MSGQIFDLPDMKSAETLAVILCPVMVELDKKFVYAYRCFGIFTYGYSNKHLVEEMVSLVGLACGGPTLNLPLAESMFHVSGTQ